MEEIPFGEVLVPTIGGLIFFDFIINENIRILNTGKPTHFHCQTGT